MTVSDETIALLEKLNTPTLSNALEDLGISSREFESRSMYFGGVGAALWSPNTGFSVAADPRRTGGVWCAEHQC